MNVSIFFMKLKNGLTTISEWEYRTILCIVIVTTVGISIYTSYEIGYEVASDEHFIVSETDFPNHLNFMRASLVIGFASSLIGLWSRKAIGLLILAIAMIYVGIAYTWWYLETLDFFRGAEILGDPKGMEEIGMFRNAGWFDYLVLIVAVALVLWIVRIIIRSLSSIPSQNTP
jgi:hypothetical protein